MAYYYFKNLFLYRKYDFFIAIDEVLYRKILILLFFLNWPWKHNIMFRVLISSGTSDLELFSVNIMPKPTTYICRLNFKEDSS